MFSLARILIGATVGHRLFSWTFLLTCTFSGLRDECFYFLQFLRGQFQGQGKASECQLLNTCGEAIGWESAARLWGARRTILCWFVTVANWSRCLACWVLRSPSVLSRLRFFKDEGTDGSLSSSWLLSSKALSLGLQLDECFCFPRIVKCGGISDSEGVGRGRCMLT